MNKDIPWDPSVSDDVAWAKKAFESLQAGALSVVLRRRRGISTVIAHGPCPRCAHEVAYEQVRNAAIPAWRLGRRLKERSDSSVGFCQVDVRCMCGSPEHDGRPSHVSGGGGLVFPVRVQEQEG